MNAGTLSRNALTIAFALLVVAGCAKPEPPPEPIRPVQLTQVRMGGTVDNTVFAGEVKPRHETDLGFRIGGKIVARYVDMGARVKKGQALARLDPSDVGLQAEAAKAALAAAEAEFTFAKAEYERYQNLQAQNFVSASALDQKRNAFNSTRAKHEQAKAQFAVSQNQAAYATLVAEHDGVITTLSAEPGQVVSAGQTVMRLAREEEREVAISVPENRVRDLARTQQIAVVLWAAPQKFYAARVRETAPAVDPVTRTFATRVSILDPDAAVQWGMTANVLLRRDANANTALLPLTSIYQRDGNPAVWVYDTQAQKVSLRPVTIGQFREDGVVVTEGLANGEWVVSAGVHKLRPGQVVRPFDNPELMVDERDPPVPSGTAGRAARG